MYINDDKLDILIGKLPTEKSKTFSPFDPKIIKFLDTISKTILLDKKINKFPDLKQFGFWCRKSNLINLSKNYQFKKTITARGVALHIPPSNVPLNFAFSLAFGLLSGCTNIVRVPSRNFDQIAILLKILSKILNKDNFVLLKKNLCLLKYERSDEISDYLSSISDVRLIWGGDETINKFKKYKTKTKNLDLFFPDKFSISLINTSKLSKLSTQNLKVLAANFYNDTYTMDQLGCSSPRLVIWHGKKSTYIKNKFWEYVYKHAKNRYNLDFSGASKKIHLLSNFSIKSDKGFNTSIKDLVLTRLKFNSTNNNIDKIKSGFGIFPEINIHDLRELRKIIKENFQTITYYGLNKKEIIDTIFKYKIRGIDRIVPIGQAFNIGPIWDGYDIIYHMTRVIE